MNSSKNLYKLGYSFEKRIRNIQFLAKSDQIFAGRFCIFCISQLNNYLRAYLFSILNGAKDQNNNLIHYSGSYATKDIFIDNLVRFGKPKKWKAGRVGIWTENDEPAYHSPTTFLRIVSKLNPNNINNITTAMTDSWKIDALRHLRNYFAHRSNSTEKKAIIEIKSHYVVSDSRAKNIIFENDATIGKIIIDDISDYLIELSKGIS